MPPGPGAAEGIARLRAAGVTLAIASLTWLFAVRWFAARWGIDHCAGTGLTEGGEITHLFAEDKATWTLALGRRLGIGPDAMAAIGDSDGDLPLLRAVHHPFFVGRALPPGLAAAHRPAADIAVLAGEILAL